MASASTKDYTRIPAGTAVGIYLARQRREGAAPDGAAVAAGTMNADGVSGVAFSALAADTDYVIYALVAGEHRYVSVTSRGGTGDRFVSDGEAREPAQNGLEAWTMAPDNTGNFSTAAGVGVYTKIWLPRSFTASAVELAMATAGTVLTGSYVALYDESEAKVAETAESSAVFMGAAGLISIPFAVARALVGGRGRFAYLGILFATATSLPVLRGGGTLSADLGQNTAARPTVFSAGAALATLPAVLPAVGSRNVGPLLAGLR